MSNTSSTELLERIVAMLEESKIEALAVKQEIFAAIDANKTRDERIRGELIIMNGNLDAIRGEIKRLSGNVVVLGATVEELERSERLIHRHLDGLTQLTKNESAKKELAEKGMAVT